MCEDVDMVSCVYNGWRYEGEVREVEDVGCLLSMILNEYKSFVDA